MKFEFATANRIIFGPGRFGEIGEIAELLEVSLVPLPANPGALAEQNAEGMITKSIPDPQAFAEHFNEALLKSTLAEMNVGELVARKLCEKLGIVVEEPETFQQALARSERYQREREDRFSRGMPL